MKLSRIVLLASLLWPPFLVPRAAAATAASQTAPQPEIYAATTFYHVEDAKHDAFEAFELSQTRKLLEGLTMVDQTFQGALLATMDYGWSPYPASNYSMTLVSVGWPNNRISLLDAASRKALGKSYDEYLREAVSLRTQVGQTLSRQQAGTPDSVEEGDIIRIDWMKVLPGRMEDYIRMERSVQRVREAQVNSGQLKAWSMWTVSTPTGAEVPFDAYTVYVGKDIEAVLTWGQVQAETLAKLDEPFHFPFAAYTNELRKVMISDTRRVLMNIKR